ncbi:polyketide synthase, putative [Pseudozyma hubeiensis SY62]|uniref:Polyketide synthase, putative n=1 Tax=Pseudozyma hubeiensis (strain SY62) TaxID=1305764 RepID=R9P298_PSEHS|nr:polyketide synthase, putative [Pseudozyma hubeiensis SY62]GAC95354.1 polyketide synthase, putative [Pseudozyma hubeiensis SY62]
MPFFISSRFSPVPCFAAYASQRFHCRPLWVFTGRHTDPRIVPTTATPYWSELIAKLIKRSRATPRFRHICCAGREAEPESENCLFFAIGPASIALPMDERSKWTSNLAALS